MRGHARLRSILGVLGVGLLAAALCIARVPWQLHDVAWAEDANVFLRDALVHDPWSVIGTGYAGYLHVVPRALAAFVMSVVPVTGYATAVFFVCAILTGLVGAAVFHLAKDIVAWMPARLVLALLPVLLPLSAQEVLGNLANLHTLAFWLVLWVLFSRPRSWASAIGWAVVVFVCGASEIQTIVLLGLAPFFVRRRDPRRWPAYIALVLAAGWQVATLISTPRPPADHVLSALSYPYGWLINAVLPMVNADPGSAGIWLDRTGLVVPALALLPFLAAAAIVFARGSARQRLLVATALLLSFGLYAGSAWVNASAGLDYAADGPMSERFLHMRYGVSAGILLATTVPVAASVLRDRPIGRPALSRAAAIAAVAGLALVLTVSGTRSFAARALVDGPWSAGAGQAVGICAAAPPDQEVVLPVAPQRVLIIDCAAWNSYPAR